MRAEAKAILDRKSCNLCCSKIPLLHSYGLRGGLTYALCSGHSLGLPCNIAVGFTSPLSIPSAVCKLRQLNDTPDLFCRRQLNILPFLAVLNVEDKRTGAALFLFPLPPLHQCISKSCSTNAFPSLQITLPFWAPI